MANEPECNSQNSSFTTNNSSNLTPETPVMKKFMYKSPLSGLKSAYNPPVDKSGFKPIGVSSPKPGNRGSGDRFAITIEGPPQNRPKQQFNQESNRTPDRRPRPSPNANGGNAASLPSLVGRGGHWRGPHGNDMSPDNRQHSGRRDGYRGSPGPEELGGLWNSPQQNSDGYRGHNDNFGRNSYRQNNFGRNSCGSNPRNTPPYSPHSPFSSSDNRSRNSSHSSRRGNRGGNRSQRSDGDIGQFYSSSMKDDPWAELMQEKLNESSFQIKTPMKEGLQSFNMNVTSDSDLDEGVVSQETDTPPGEDSS